MKIGNISLVMFEIYNIISTLLGLLPCSIKISRQSSPRIGASFAFSYSQLGFAYNIFLAAVLIVISIISVPHLQIAEYPNNSYIVKNITFILTLMGNALAAAMITLYAILQSVIIQIGNRLYAFDNNYGNKLIERRDDAFGVVKLFLPISVIFIWIGVGISTIMMSEEKYLLYSGLFGASMSWFLLQYSLMIHSLRRRFQGLNDALLATTRSPISFENNLLYQESLSSDRSIVKNLLTIKKARGEMCRISRQVSRFYSCPVLAIIFYCCCSSVHSIYFYLMVMIFPDGDSFPIDSIDSYFWVLLEIYPLIVLCASVNAFHAETDRTADVVYDVMEKYPVNREIGFQLNNFAVELLHKRIHFTACGLFSLDCRLLHSIFGMIVTYLLILWQFKPMGNTRIY